MAQFLAFAALSLITFGLVRFIVKFGAEPTGTYPDPGHLS